MGSTSDGGDADDPVAAAEADWRSSTTALERVRQVVERTTTAKTASEIATEALVSEPTARKHLESLVEVGTAAANREGSATTYFRDEDRHLYRRIRDLAADHTREELLDSIREMKAEVADFQAEYDAASPEQLATSLDGDASAAAWEAVSEWQTVERNLHVAQAAINYGRARDLGAATQ
jgi:DNA-binding transcriptional ArsR family regulator